MQRYNPKEIEPKWQKIWDETGVYTADLQSSKPKYIAMSMFNYPSGAGIHIGHAMNYTISDVKARFKRQQGYESYHPVGWDAFGLPAENYAIKSGVSPQASMAKIIPDYHKQYKAMGWSNDWSKEIATHEPSYYKWTQWIFARMFDEGLAYQDSRMQWWCAIDNTVLANEQVIDGKCWRHDGPDDPLVEKREIKQWFFKITDYADELLEATDDLDWTESVKLAQKNWIGRSIGAVIDFPVVNSPNERPKIYNFDEVKLEDIDAEPILKVFTTRPDTLYGATFMVIAPEHELVPSITSEAQKEAVEAYIDESVKKTEVERQANKEKTGVFTGSYAINPLSDEAVPIWVADYVLAGYGTGAIMAVPAHDERDFEFAKKFNLPIKKVFTAASGKDAEWYAGEGTMIGPAYKGKTTSDAREDIVHYLESMNQGHYSINYRMRDWSVSRQRYWGAPIPIINCPKCGAVRVPDDQLPVVLPELDDFQPTGDGRSALARATDWLHVQCPSCGGDAERETDTLDTYIDSSWYMYRYFDPKNEQAIFDSNIVNKWAPIDFYNGGDHATAHLLYARFVVRFLSKIGLVKEPEPFKHMLFNGKVTASDGSAFSKSKGNGVDPLEIINSGYGADALRTYLMFAAPLEIGARWDPQGVPGTHRFLSRLWALVQEYNEAGPSETSENQQRELLRITHQTIKKMTEDIEHNTYNTAIAAAMTMVNELFKLKAQDLKKNGAWKQALNALVACVAPFAPHIADELWQQLGHETSVQAGSWPMFNEDYIATESVTIAVQVNGKLRGEVQVAAEATEEAVVEVAKANEKVASYLTGDPKKTIYVPGKLVNFVI
ncbi:MAG TPA: leucine--tRNA ligase [Candidatus Saccharimonadales bacterium]|nr:leucine--tRNA ligase [Candidatus Saccharimonadales bacterium]